VIHEIAARRSTRRFIKKNIPEEDLHALLEAASTGFAQLGMALGAAAFLGTNKRRRRDEDYN